MLNDGISDSGTCSQVLKYLNVFLLYNSEVILSSLNVFVNTKYGSNQPHILNTYNCFPRCFIY